MRACPAFAVLLSLAPFLRSQTAVTTAHYDNFRTGANINEMILTPANVNSNQFGELARLPVDGCIFAQPLYVPRVTTNRGSSDLVFTATSENSIYAFDAVDYTLHWQRNFGAPFPSGVIPSYFAFLNCKDDPENAQPGGIGITGTPVIDASLGAMYFVANTIDGDPDSPKSHHILHKIRLSDGGDMAPPVEIGGWYQGTTFDSRYQLQRSALLLLNGRIYIAFGSHGDEIPYYGWMFSYDTSLQQTAVINYSPRKWGAGIWQSGGGPASDGNYIYLSTGNNVQDEADPTDNSDSILQVDPLTLEVIAKASFYPESNDWDENSDIDLGSSRTIALPGTGRVISGSKYGDLFLVNGNGMLLEDREQAAARHSAGFDWTGIYNGLAYWNNKVYAWPGGGGFIYHDDLPYPVDTLKAFALAPDASSVEMIARGQSDEIGVGYQGAGLVISANGQIPSTGIVWAYTPASNTLAIQPGYLRAYSANDLADGVFRALWDNTAGEPTSFAKMNQPLVANGKVFLPTFSLCVAVYGLRSSN